MKLLLEAKLGETQQDTPVPSTTATPCPLKTMGAEAVPEFANVTLSL